MATWPARYVARTNTVVELNASDLRTLGRVTSPSVRTPERLSAAVSHSLLMVITRDTGLVPGLDSAMRLARLAVVGLVLMTAAACGSSSPSPAPNPPAGASGPSADARLGPGGESSPASTLTVTSPVFTDGGTIPAAYTCAGAGKMPAISWSGDLKGSTALAVVVDDPDAPVGTFVHLIVLDLLAGTTSLGDTLPAGARYALNGAGRPGWTPPCPPSGTHQYRFTVYGLSAPTGLPDGSGASDAEAAIQGHALVQGRLTGLVSP